MDELLKPELWEETALADFKNGGRSYGMITSIWQLRGEAKAMEYAASFNSQLPYIRPVNGRLLKRFAAAEKRSR